MPSDKAEREVPHDFLLCRQYEPLGERLGYFGTQEYTEDWNDDGVWACVGCAGDLAGGQRPFVQLHCSFEDSEDSGGGQVLETECDLSKGESGGPFWAWFPNNDPRIVAVVQGEADFAVDLGLFEIHDHDNSAAGGSRHGPFGRLGTRKLALTVARRLMACPCNDSSRQCCSLDFAIGGAGVGLPPQTATSVEAASRESGVLALTLQVG
jgi:hypothetical protein